MRKKCSKLSIKNFFVSENEYADNSKRNSFPIVSSSIQKIANGTIIVFTGTLIGMIMAFVTKIIVIRHITQNEYGMYSLTLVLVNITVAMSVLGLQEGSTRFIAYFRGKEEGKKIRKVIFSSIKIALMSSIAFSSIIFLFSYNICTNIFHISELVVPLRILSISIPFTVLTIIFTSFFRGFDKVGPNVYFQNILFNILFLLSLITSVVIGLSFLGVIYAYLASAIITCAIFLIYVIKKLPTHITKFFNKKENIANISTDRIGKKLLLFSIPLLAVTILDSIMNWTDVLMLGYFKTTMIVGLYNGALPIARLIPITLTSLAFIYVPIISGLYSKELLNEIKRAYQIITKWVFYITLPLFFIVFLFPEVLLDSLFGSQYIGASTVLRILAMGFLIHVFLGANGMTLLVIGKTKFLMWSSLFSVIINIVLNTALIPMWGIVGASIATILSLLLMNSLRSIKLYLGSQIHPFTNNYLKSVLAIISFTFVAVFLFKEFFAVTFWLLPIFFILFIIINILIIFLTRSLDMDDIAILLEIKQRLGIDVPCLEKLIKRLCKWREY